MDLKVASVRPLGDKSPYNTLIAYHLSHSSTCIHYNFTHLCMLFKSKVENAKYCKVKLN